MKPVRIGEMAFRRDAEEFLAISAYDLSEASTNEME